MRVLCLHGSDANTKVSRSQTAPFRQELRRIVGDDSLLEFTYLQGNMDSLSYPGVSQLFGPPYYKFFDQDSPSSVIQGMDYIASSININKPHIIFAHSDGAGAVLSTLLHRSCTVKCLILVSPFPPFDQTGTRRLDVSLTGTPLFNIPILLVRGNQDLMAHFVTFAQELVNEKSLTVYSWEGGHSVPNSSERGMWAQIAQEAVEIVNRCN